MKKRLKRRLVVAAVASLVGLLGVGVVAASWILLKAQSAEAHLLTVFLLARESADSGDTSYRLEGIRRELIAVRADLDEIAVPLDIARRSEPLVHPVPVLGEQAATYIHLAQAIDHGTNAAIRVVDALLYIAPPATSVPLLAATPEISPTQPSVDSLLSPTPGNSPIQLSSAEPVSRSIVAQITSAADDHYQLPNGTRQFMDRVYLGGEYHAGFRFTHLDIPKEAEINSAVLSVAPHWWDDSQGYMTVYGEAADNPSSFASGSISSRPRTLAFVRWALSQPWVESRYLKSPDISSIIQEIISRPGWRPGNGLVVLVDSPATAWRAVTSYETSPSLAGRLTITYTTSGLTADAASITSSGPDAARTAVSEPPGNVFTSAVSWLAEHPTELSEIVEELRLANLELGQVDPQWLPDGWRPSIEKAQQLLGSINGFAQEAMPLMGPALDALGFDGRRVYLILVQNNLELRPTGGFIGLYGVVQIEDGSIVDSQIRDSYDFPKIETERVGYPAAPAPLQYYLGLTGLPFRDLNWSPDFPSVARLASEFYSREFGREPDGIIAVNFALARRLLAVIGPVEVPEMEEVLTSENLYERYSERHWVLPTYKQDWTAFVGALSSKFRHRDFSYDLTLIEALAEGAREKEILIALSQPTLQARLQEMNWDGAVRPSSGDYLMINDANLGVNKISSDLQNDVSAEVTAASDGAVRTTLVMTMTNLNPRSGQLVYRQIYLPRAAQLDELETRVVIDGKALATVLMRWEDNKPVLEDVRETDTYSFGQLAGHSLRVDDVAQEFGKVVIGIPIAIPEDNAQAVLTLTYSTPGLLLKHGDQWEYRLVLQRQPGAEPLPFTLNLVLPVGATQVVDAGPFTSKGTGTRGVRTSLRQDQEFVLRFR